MQSRERWTVLLAILCGPLVGAGESGEATGAKGALRSYIAALEELHGLWNRVAELVSASRYDEARASLKHRASEALPETYRRRQAALPQNLNTIEHHRKLHPVWQAMAELFLHLESPALAAQWYQRPDQEGRLYHEKHWLQYAEALIALGRLDEADEQLQKAATQPGSAGTGRLKALRTLKPYAEATLADLIEKYYHPTKNHGRASSGIGVVLRVWRSNLEEPRKLSLLARAFEGFRDSTGQRHAAMALGELPGAIDDPNVAGLLLDTGNRLHREKRLDEALKVWAPVVAHCRAAHVWGKAAFNSGLALRQLGRPKEAIVLLERLLCSDVEDREPGGHIMEAFRNYRHRACLEISTSYQQLKDYDKALDYALMGRDTHRFQTWCGTCAMSSRAALRARIERLAKLAGRKDVLDSLRTSSRQDRRRGWPCGSGGSPVGLALAGALVAGYRVRRARRRAGGG